jgi:ribosomal protein S18 acetylase RimI-like enzyme
VRLSVALKNHAAHRFYARLGFRDASRGETHIHMECSHLRSPAT